MKRIVAMLLCCLLTLTMFAGCQKAVEEKPSAGSAPAANNEPAGNTANAIESIATPPPVDTTVEYKDTVYLSYMGDINSADPYYSASSAKLITTNCTFRTLTWFNYGTRQLDGVLMESWEYNDDCTQLTGHLRKGVKFHNGAEFTAKDVEFTWNFCKEVTNVKNPIPNADKMVSSMPYIAYPLTVMDCSGVSDGCSCAIITRANVAKQYRKDPMYVKALQIASGNGHNQKSANYDFTYVEETLNAARAAYKEAGITNPKEQVSVAEVHDCFTITELLIYEDLGFSDRGQAWKDVLDGKFDRDGKLPVNIDGGLKSFGHPIGASGLRMIYEMWLQFHGRAGKRQRENMRVGMTHNMGGRPYCCVAGITICGMDLG